MNRFLKLFWGGILLPLFMNSVQAQGLVPDDIEYKALEELYNNTAGDYWWDNSGWLQDSSFWNWYGVEVIDGDVAYLDLSFNDLTGSIPASIGDLTALEELWMEFNYLEGPLPSEIGHLENLKVCALAYNFLTGNLPSSVGNLQQLQVLILNGNSFDGELPITIWTLTNLLELDLTFNNFSGELPPNVGQLQNLEVLSLMDNLFTGELPDEIGDLAYLYKLYLSYNQFSGKLPERLENLSYLEDLAIDNNQFIGPIPELMNALPLRGLWANNNSFNSFPDFTLNSGNGDMIVQIENNQMDFGDIEKNFVADNEHVFSVNFFYWPQDSVDTFFDPATFTFSIEVDGQYNQYQWMKNGVNISGAVSDQLTTPEPDFSENDIYQCRITNTRIPNLTLHSKSKIIRPGQYWAIADGNWKDFIWSREKDGEPADTYPGEGSEVFISGRNVSVTDSVTCGPVHVIVENGGASLTVDGAEMTIVGELELVKENEGYPGNVKVINGGRIVPVE